MPLFFLLSGFTLQVIYGSKKFSCKKFNLNRFARVFPVYYLCTFLALPFWFNGIGDFSQKNTDKIYLSLITSIIPINTLFNLLLGSPIDGPGWTVCTLAIMWLFFPISSRNANKLTDDQLLYRIKFCHYLQLVLVFILFMLILPFLGF